MTTEASKNTPGPWGVFPFSTGRDWDIYALDGIVIATSFGDDEEHTANADLMAAAPEMRAALEAIEQWEALMILGATDRFWDSLSTTEYEALLEAQTLRNAALAKARGDA